jgi:hypothetical protein
MAATAATNPFDDFQDALLPNNDPPASKRSPTSSSVGWIELSGVAMLGTVDKRARRRREEAVSRLVADALRPPDFLLDESGLASVASSVDGKNNGSENNNNWKDEEYSNHALETAKIEARLRSRQHSTLLLASTVASSIERGLDKELHAELVWQGKQAQGVIGRICHDHSEDFLESVGKVVAALGGPCEEVRSSLEEVSSVCFESVVPRDITDAAIDGAFLNAILIPIWLPSASHRKNLLPWNASSSSSSS